MIPSPFPDHSFPDRPSPDSLSPDRLGPDSPALDSPAPAESEVLTLTGRCLFRNAVAYRLPPGWDLSAADLEAALDRALLAPCGPLENERHGWVYSTALGRTVHSARGAHLIALGSHRKLLPASLIRQEVTRRAAALAAEQGIPVGRKQKRALQEAVRVELLAKALVRTSATRALLDPARGWLIVEAGSASRAETLVEALRDTLGSLAATPLEPTDPPATTLAAWLRADRAPGPLTLDSDLELQDAHGASVRYARHALDGGDIKIHLDEGKRVVRLGLLWKDRVAFVLTARLELKRLSFLVEPDADADEAEGPGRAPATESLEADLLLLVDDLTGLCTDLAQALGAPLEPAA